MRVFLLHSYTLQIFLFLLTVFLLHEPLLLQQNIKALIIIIIIIIIITCQIHTFIKFDKIHESSIMAIVLLAISRSYMYNDGTKDSKLIEEECKNRFCGKIFEV